MAETIASKLLTVLYLSMFSGGVLLQIPSVKDVIDADKVTVGVYNTILVFTALLWGAKAVLRLYEKKREIDERFRDKK